MIPPLELLDVDGEGIYLLNDPDYPNDDPPGVLMRAAWLLHGTWREWREVDHETVYMRPKDDGSDDWVPADIGKHPRGWRLNLPKRWRPVAYAYCTPKVAA